MRKNLIMFLFVALFIGFVVNQSAKAETPFPKSFAEFEKVPFEKMKGYPDIKWPLDKKITESDFKDKSETEIILLRNSIYAQHGFRFSQVPMANYFLSRSWYKPNSEDLNTDKLSTVSRHNVEALLKYQASLKDGGRNVASSYGPMKDKIAYYLFLMGFCTYRVGSEDKAGMVVFQPAGEAKVFHSKLSRMAFEPYAYDEFLEKSTAQWGDALFDAKWSIEISPNNKSATVVLNFPDSVYDKYLNEKGRPIIPKGPRRLVKIAINDESGPSTNFISKRSCEMAIMK